MNHGKGHPNHTPLIALNQNTEGFAVPSFRLLNKFGFVGRRPGFFTQKNWTDVKWRNSSLRPRPSFECLGAFRLNRFWAPEGQGPQVAPVGSALQLYSQRHTQT